MTTTTHELVGDYLRQLQRAARVLPRPQADELIAEIRDHLDAGLAPDASEADVRNILDELGSPDEIVAAARPDRPQSRRGLRETFALLLLLTGFPPIIGWLAGGALLLASPLWSAKQKVLGLLVWPGGYVIALGMGLLMPAPEGFVLPSILSLPALVVLVVSPLAVMVYLYRAAGRQGDDAPAA